MKQQTLNPDELKKVLGNRLEGEIQLSILQYLRSKGYWVSRWQNLPIYDEKIGRRRKNPYIMPGMPDILCFVPIRSWKYKFMEAVAIEVKRGGYKGDVKGWQKTFRERWELSGNRYIIAQSLDDIIRERL